MSVAVATAEVVLALPIRRRFHYAIPPETADLICRGTVAAVPFGARIATGYVTAVEPRPGDAPAELKAIGEVLLAGPAISDELLVLAEFVADYYRASVGEVLRAALPIAKVRSFRRAEITDAGRAVLGGDGFALTTQRAGSSAALSAADRLLLVALRERGALAPGVLAQDVAVPSVAARLRRLAGDGLVAIDTVVRRSMGERCEEYLSLAQAAESVLDAAVVKRSPVARAVVELLSETDSALAWSEIRQRSSATRTHVRRLIDAGLVVSEQRRIDRDLAVATRATTRLSDLVLTAEQRAVVAEVTTSCDEQRFQPFLLHGVTGAGKSLVYLACIEHVLGRDQSAILLVPEIALTPVFARELRGRFGDQVAILHSGLKPGERHDAWQRIRRGDARVVFGTRSAVFAPVPRLGLIIVDEEHDGSYKQSERPHYHARDVAVARASLAGVPCVLGSATPSLESYRNAEGGRYRLLELSRRVAGQELPSVEIVDMRLEFERVGADVVLSERLETELRRRVADGEQAVVLLNRRGFASFLLCRDCGVRAQCPNCSVCLTYHRREERMKCHQCEYRRPPPSACPSCKGSFLHLVGHGTERIEEAVRACLPDARIERLDRDTARGRDDIEDILGRFERGELDVLVGTQMVAKGHDFPRVTLVGVVSVDAMLALPDFRATERAFSLLTQVAGRAGRGERPGHVLLQTFHPDNEAVKLACAQDYRGFFAREMRLRTLMRYPPTAHLVGMIVRGRDRRGVEGDALAVKRILSQQRERGIRILGPAMAPIERRKGQFRAQLLLSGGSRAAVKRVLEAADHELEPMRSRGILELDVDPQDLM